MDNTQILTALDSALKNVISVSDLGDGVLAKQKFDRFVEAAQHKTTILPEARFIEMDSHVVEIDRIGFVGRILKSGQENNGDHKTLSEGDFVKPTFATNTLTARELQAVVSIRDKALRRNIEQGNLEDTLIDLFGEAAGRDLEEFALLSDDSFGADDLALSLTDGWLQKAEQKIYGTGASKDFDKSDDNFPENLFEAMLTAIPKQFIDAPGEWRIWVNWETQNAYRDLLKARGTALGDTALTSNEPLYYKGFPVVYAPVLERSKTTGNDGNGEVALFGHPDNLVWGIFHEINIEPEREAKKRQTDFVLTVEADAHYEDENAAVAAFFDKED